MIIILLKQEFISKKSIKNSTFYYLIVSLFLLVNLNVFQYLAMPAYIFDSIEIYAKELSAFREEQKKRNVGDIEFEAIKEKGKELYV